VERGAGRQHTHGFKQIRLALSIFAIEKVEAPFQGKIKVFVVAKFI
jgi:hypothetical protein